MVGKGFSFSLTLTLLLTRIPIKTIIIVIYLFLLRSTVEWFLSSNPFAMEETIIFPSNIISWQLFVINVASFYH